MRRHKEALYEKVLDDESIEERLIDVDESAEREFSNRQFAFPKRPFPFREISLGLGLLLGGTFLTMLGLLNLSGIWGNKTEGSSAAFIFLGLMALTPGSYASWIAYNSWRGTKGYSFDQMPQIHRGA